MLPVYHTRTAHGASNGPGQEGRPGGSEYTDVAALTQSHLMNELRQHREHAVFSLLYTASLLLLLPFVKLHCVSSVNKT